MDLTSTIGVPTRSLPDVRVEGLVGKQGVGWNPGAMSHTVSTYRQTRSAGTCARALGIRAVGDWFPFWEPVALRLARKIRRWLAEGCRVSACPDALILAAKLKG